jgi:hypothetical protein
MTKLKEIWSKKWKILEGIWYNHVIFKLNKTHWAYREVKIRRSECASCEFLDKDGSGPEAVIKGKPACGICGCNIKELTACLSCSCSLSDVSENPKWKAISLKKDYLIEEKIDKLDNGNKD